jgi:hypothetical protein
LKIGNRHVYFHVFDSSDFKLEAMIDPVMTRGTAERCAADTKMSEVHIAKAHVRIIKHRRA